MQMNTLYLTWGKSWQTHLYLSMGNFGLTPSSPSCEPQMTRGCLGTEYIFVYQPILHSYLFTWSRNIALLSFFHSNRLFWAILCKEKTNGRFGYICLKSSRQQYIYLTIRIQSPLGYLDKGHDQLTQTVHEHEDLLLLFLMTLN